METTSDNTLFAICLTFPIFIATILFICVKIEHGNDIINAEAKERKRIISQLLRLGPHRLRGICKGEGVEFMIRSEDEGVAAVGAEEGEDSRDELRIISEQISQYVRAQLRTELRLKMEGDVRRDVGRELKGEIRAEMKRSGGEVGLIAEAVADIREEVRREVQQRLRREMERDVR